MAGPLVWEDYIVGDEDSFDDSFVPSICAERSLEDHHDSVEVVPLSRGAAIITKNSYLDGNASYTGKASPANESMPSFNKDGQQTNQRNIIPKLFGRRKPALIPLSTTKADHNAEETDLSGQNARTGCVHADVEAERGSLLSPLSESHSESSVAGYPSLDEESSGGESSPSISKKRATLTDKAADWVYRGARAAGFFSYSSDDEKMTQFSISSKDGTQMHPTSDLSESAITDEASEIVIGQLKYWIQTETTLSNAEETLNGAAHASTPGKIRNLNDVADDREPNPHHTLDHFKKILLLAQRLNLSPHDLITRLEQGENIEELLHQK
jgi:hypothetical protein